MALFSTPEEVVTVYEFDTTEQVLTALESDAIQKLIAEFDRLWSGKVVRARAGFEIVYDDVETGPTSRPVAPATSQSSSRPRA